MALKRWLSSEDIAKLKALNNPKVEKVVEEFLTLCKPEKARVIDDSEKDSAYVRNLALENKEEEKLKLEGHTIHFDGYHDQARDKKNTKILIPTSEKHKYGKHLNVMDRDEGLKEIFEIMDGIMEGKIALIRFFCLGPINSIFSIPALQITDSAYVAHSEDILYRRGYEEFKRLKGSGDFFYFIHSAGELTEARVSKNIEKRRIYVDLLENRVFSANNQYAGNSLGLKKLALRLAIHKAVKEGWLAEHMFISGVTNLDKKRKSYFLGAFPSACGKTSTAMLPGETILGDDIAYIRAINSVARAVNVECGIFGILQGINPKNDPVIFKALTSPGEVIFSNVLVKDGKPYWLGMGCELPKDGINYTGYWWEGKTDEHGNPIPPAHKNARYTISLKALENCDPELDNPLGVELGGIMYGGRDSKAYVPVQQSFNWEHGIICYGAALETETTFAIVGKEGIPEINAMSIQDFISIPLGQNIRNNLAFGKKLKKPPIIFGVNYFLRDLETGEYLNSPRDKHVWVKWMELRVHNDVGALKAPTGLIPKYEDLRVLFKKVLGKEYRREDYIKQFTIRVPENLAKIERVKRFYKEKVSDTPEELFQILDQQRERLLKTRERFGDYVPPDRFEEE